METQKGPYKDYSPSKMGLYRFPCEFGRVYTISGVRQEVSKDHERLQVGIKDWSSVGTLNP